MEEAERNTTQFYAEISLDFFRPPGGNPGAREGGKKWNKKFTASADRACAAFNGKRDHKADELLADGTCKRNHVCDQWVDNKGPGGQCMGSEGPVNHARDKCPNTHKCTERPTK